MVNKIITFAKEAARKMRVWKDPTFPSKAFKLCRDVVGTVESLELFDRAIEDEGIEDSSNARNSEHEDQVQDDLGQHEMDPENDDLPLNQLFQVGPQPSRPKRRKRGPPSCGT